MIISSNEPFLSIDEQNAMNLTISLSGLRAHAAAYSLHTTVLFEERDKAEIAKIITSRVKERASNYSNTGERVWKQIGW
jgi:hypothetical protein